MFKKRGGVYSEMLTPHSQSRGKAKREKEEIDNLKKGWSCLTKIITLPQACESSDEESQIGSECD